MLRVVSKYVFLISVLFCFFSCVSHNSMLILKDSSAVQDTLMKRLITEYNLQTGDILDIKVSSLDPNSVAVFNKNIGVASNGSVTEGSLYVNGYMVDQFGDINVPLIGDLRVAGISVDSLNKKLDVLLRKYFKSFTVEAKLVSFRVSVLGEVRQPGTHIVYNRNVNVLQALSEARGITEFGNRKRIKVIRKAFSCNESYVLDITSEDVISSPFFYLMPNDVVYVEPNRSKAISLNVPLFALIVSATSLAVLVVNSVSRN